MLNIDGFQAGCEHLTEWFSSKNSSNLICSSLNEFLNIAYNTTINIYLKLKIHIQFVMCDV